jgi:hypothetical protein
MNCYQSVIMAKGRKRVRGVPELHDELKTRVNLSLTPTGIEGLDTLASKWGLSRSELVEKIGRGHISIADRQDFSDDKNYSNAELITTTEFADEFTMSAIQSMQLNQCDELPECPGAYLVTDFEKYIYAGRDSNLKRRFMDERFLKQLQNSLTPNSSLIPGILWVECSNVRTLPAIEQVLITTFHSMTTQISSVLYQAGQARTSRFVRRNVPIEPI